MIQISDWGSGVFLLVHQFAEHCPWTTECIVTKFSLLLLFVLFCGTIVHSCTGAYNFEKGMNQLIYVRIVPVRGALSHGDHGNHAY